MVGHRYPVSEHDCCWITPDTQSHQAKCLRLSEPSLAEPICHDPGPGPLATCSGCFDHHHLVHKYQLETDIISRKASQ